MVETMSKPRDLSICHQAPIISGAVEYPETSTSPAEHYDICSECGQPVDGCYIVHPCVVCGGLLGPHTPKSGLFECENGDYVGPSIHLNDDTMENPSKNKESEDKKMYLSENVSDNVHHVVGEEVAKPNRIAMQDRNGKKIVLDAKAIRALRRSREPVNKIRQERIDQRRGRDMK